MADQQSEDSTQANFNDLQSLVGHWVGPGFSGICEESWLPASGGSMLGTFKLVKDGEVVFSELMTITIDATGPVLKVKHFSGDFIAWEQKDEFTAFPFTEMTDNSIVFSGLHYEFPAKDSLDIIVDMKSKDGSVHKETISCKRQ